MLSRSAEILLKARYLRKNERPEDLFLRVAETVGKFDPEYREDFFEVMKNFEFLPNSPALFNAGTGRCLSACFVIPLRDSLKSIFQALRETVIVEQWGGGVGLNFSRIRPEGDRVSGTGGSASGPVSFMRVFDTATEVVKSGGRRRGAMMALLSADHPDVGKFVASSASFRNFNLSVAVPDRFIDSAVSGSEWEYVNPRTGRTVSTGRAGALWKKIVRSAWKTGGPGLAFMDEIERKNPVPGLGRIEGLNPCGETPLLAYESCNLGSVNLSKVVRKRVRWKKLERIVRIGVRFLDAMIDASGYPFRKMEEAAKRTRKIGLGVMGFADALSRLGIPYDSGEAVRFAEEVMSFISGVARRTSVELGEEKGSFPAFEESVWTDYGAMRNATVTAVAPTGSISLLAGCSSGIEPFFSLFYTRRICGVEVSEFAPGFLEFVRERGYQDVLSEISRTGSARASGNVPEELKRLFPIAHEIDPEWHVRIQAAFQRHVDNAVSKTVNLPGSAGEEVVERVFLLARKLGCKGVTVYRYGSLGNQVIERPCERCSVRD